MFPVLPYSLTHYIYIYSLFTMLSYLTHFYEMNSDIIQFLKCYTCLCDHCAY